MVLLKISAPERSFLETPLPSASHTPELGRLSCPLSGRTAPSLHASCRKCLENALARASGPGVTQLERCAVPDTSQSFCFFCVGNSHLREQSIFLDCPLHTQVCKLFTFYFENTPAPGKAVYTARRPCAPVMFSSCQNLPTLPDVTSSLQKSSPVPGPSRMQAEWLCSPGRAMPCTP